tara:strand:- start:446 stop:553 length:108 start_codon:yes stop_codon:yes gene_type:complete
VVLLLHATENHSPVALLDNGEGIDEEKTNGKLLIG